ncbi:protein DOWNY MILDEW RESISTANCE 6-like [Andrographis paniculata]|uniref:protein DOWNY MILDEW RESISTANCE 6-like n=1 Tax=Andrographis paniculata TaxID=175694 RepID=UPI0021E96EAC|nr:protein DOWNY MILDEW RESISTANCE 6-like [Andrographis paniculata]
MATKLISSAQFTTLPKNYIRPESDRPRLSEVVQCDDIPIIDLGAADRAAVVNQIADACRHYGFFKVINHGVPKETTEKMLSTVREFYALPVEEKMKLYSEDMSKTCRLSTSYIVNTESVNIWRDYLRIHCYPLHKYMPDWPSMPPTFRDVASNYCTEVRKLGFRLQEFIAESLGLPKDALWKIFGTEQAQHMSMNYYPPCPQPDLTYGLAAHTDSDILTILLPDAEVPGLQVLKDGKWLAVKPHPDAFVINIADQLEAVSNGLYKSIWHRVIANSDKERISIASFICPADGAKISAPESLTTDGKRYKDFTYDEYYNVVWTHNLDEKHPLEFFKN